MINPILALAMTTNVRSPVQTEEQAWAIFHANEFADIDSADIIDREMLAYACGWCLQNRHHEVTWSVAHPAFANLKNEVDQLHRRSNLPPVFDASYFATCLFHRHFAQWCKRQGIDYPLHYTVVFSGGDSNVTRITVQFSFVQHAVHFKLLL